MCHKKLLTGISRYLLAAVMAAGLLLARAPAAVAEGGVVINIGAVSGDGTGYTFAGGVLTITGSGEYTITGSTQANALAVAGGLADPVNLTFDSVTIERAGTPMSIGTGSLVNLTLVGASTLTAQSGDTIGLAVPAGAALTVSGAGALTVTGRGYGEGIGPAGSITINSGTVNATGGYNTGGNGKCGIRGVVTINGGTVTATGGFAVGGTGSSGIGGPAITINGGTVTANAGNTGTGHSAAGIGGGAYSESGGVITINGGTVTANGGYEGAGIGGARSGSGGTITINGGTVTAIAGIKSAGIGGGESGAGGTVLITEDYGPTHVIARGSGGGAGIGGGENNMGSGGSGGSVTIRAGTVEAYGGIGLGGAGIGAGYLGATGGQVKIQGGTVTATGGNNAAGIGGAERGTGGTIKITGGHVTATGGLQGAGIGSGYINNSAPYGTITISGGTVEATGGDRAAGIGGGFNAAGGVIIIGAETGATVVTAYGQKGGAGIGGGSNQSISAVNGSAGTVTINGGTVSAAAGANNGSGSGAGIGGGRLSNTGFITINGGLVTASAAETAAGIGSGAHSSMNGTIRDTNNVIINGGRVYAMGSDASDIGGRASYNFNTANVFNGGSVRAGSVGDAPKSDTSQNLYKTVVTVAGADMSALPDTAVTYTVDGAETSLSTATDDAGRLYLWLPQTPGGGVTTVSVWKDGVEYLAAGTVTADNAAVMTAVEQTYEIALVSDRALEDLTEGYAGGAQAAATVSITNAGTAILNNLSASLGVGEDAWFELTVPPAAPLAPGAHADVTVKAKDGLPAGDYTATVTVRADNMEDVVFRVTQVVKLISVRFDDGGHTVATRSVHYGAAIGADNWPDDPVKTGWHFDGWFTAGGFRLLPDSPIAGNTTVTAGWTAVEYGIACDLGGGTLSLPNPVSYTIQSGAITLHNPAKAGYTFTGWSGTGIAGTSASVTIPAGSTGDRAYAAHWSRINYTIAYTLGGGAASPANPTSYSVESAAITLVNPVKAGYTFTGWSGTGITGTSMTVTIPRGSMGNRAYTANWVITVYTVAAAPNNATYGTVTGGGAYHLGDICALAAVPKSGCRFVSWTEAGAAVSSAPAYSFTVSKSRALAANFARIGTPALNAPASAGYTSIRLTWSAVAGAKGYYVYRASSALGRYTKVATVTGPLYTNGRLACNTVYYYKVQAYCVAGATTTSGAMSAARAGRPVPAAPAGVRATKAASTAIRVSWSAVAGATRYEVFRASSLRGTYSRVGTVSSTYFTNKGLVRGRTYCYKVRAYRLVGRTKVYGPCSAAVTIKLR